MKLLLTCCTWPDFDDDAAELWKKFCVFDRMDGLDLVAYLRFSPASAAASIDAIVYLQAHKTAGFWTGPPYDPPMLNWWEAAHVNAETVRRIRNLPEACAMRDGRKWKRIPQIILTNDGFRHPAYDGLDVDYVHDVTEHMLHSGYGTPLTWIQIEKVINRYHEKALREYERVGFLVVIDHGRYRIKRAYYKKKDNESDFYFGGKDKRRFRGFVTVGRESEGVAHEILLFEQILNDPKTRETDIHNFLQQHPDMLSDSMMGVPVSHQPNFSTNKQTPDFSIIPVLPRDEGDWVKLLELKGPEARILADKRRLHRGLSFAVTQAIAQVNDYYDASHDPLNLAGIEKALGYVPYVAQRAVLIGRDPTVQEKALWEKRRGEVPTVKVVTYDELWKDQLKRHSWRKGV